MQHTNTSSMSGGSTTSLFYRDLGARWLTTRSKNGIRRSNKNRWTLSNSPIYGWWRPAWNLSFEGRVRNVAPRRARWPLRAAGGPQPHSALWAYQRYNFSKIRYSDHGPRRLLYVYLGMMPPAFMAAGHVGVSLVAFSPATPRACGSDDAHLRVDHARHAHDKVHVQVRHTVGAAPVECLVDVQVV